MRTIRWGLVGVLAALGPAAATWWWDAVENASGRDGPAGTGAVFAVLGAAWALAFALLFLSRAPRRDGWVCGSLAAVVAALTLARIALALPAADRFVVAVAGAPLVGLWLALGIGAGLGVEAIRRRRPGRSPDAR